MLAGRPTSNACVDCYLFRGTSGNCKTLKTLTATLFLAPLGEHFEVFAFFNYNFETHMLLPKIRFVGSWDLFFWIFSLQYGYMWVLILARRPTCYE